MWHGLPPKRRPLERATTAASRVNYASIVPRDVYSHFGTAWNGGWPVRWSTPSRSKPWHTRNLHVRSGLMRCPRSRDSAGTCKACRSQVSTPPIPCLWKSSPPLEPAECRRNAVSHCRDIVDGTELFRDRGSKLASPTKWCDTLDAPTGRTSLPSDHGTRNVATDLCATGSASVHGRLTEPKAALSMPYYTGRASSTQDDDIS